MSNRMRVAAFVAVCLLVVGGTAVYLGWRGSSRAEIPASSTPLPSTVDVPTLAGKPRIVFRNNVVGPDYGRVGIVALGDPGGPRAVTGDSCDRIDATPLATVCLVSQGGVASAYTETATGSDGSVFYTANRAGIPSRARLSPDGRLSAVTGFVSGDSYLSAGFSTRTYITDVGTGESLHLEDFALVHQGEATFAVDRNFWGVTFADDDTFYVTASFDGVPWLAKGSVSARTIETIHEAAECPSLSPDGTQIAYKKRQESGGWRLAVLNLASGVELLLPEQRSVDDQVVWQDNKTILYALPASDAGGGVFDVWAMSADGSGSPLLKISKASSPSVVP